MTQGFSGGYDAAQGREHEWLFASEEGQRQLAGACASRRVVVVAMARGQQYGDLAALQVGLRAAALHADELLSVSDVTRRTLP
jgi:hypothetical protein